MTAKAENKPTVRISWRNDNPDTIWNRLALRLGREPTASEARDEVRRILAAAIRN
jgi:hypothetical protein